MGEGIWVYVGFVSCLVCEYFITTDKKEKYGLIAKSDWYIATGLRGI